MERSIAGLLLILAGFAAAALWLQREKSDVLRGEIAMLREERDDLARLSAENRKLAIGAVTAEELARLRNDHAAVIRLRGEIEKMKATVAGREQALQATAKIGIAKEEPELAPTNAVLAARTWKNAGRATPLAAFETVLWAGTGRDLSVLATALSFDREAMDRAQEMFAGLPESDRRELRSPQRMVAALMAKDMPVGDAGISGVTSSDAISGLVKVEAEMKTKDGEATTVRFEFTRDHGGGWLMKVPVEAMEHLMARGVGSRR